jgi:hypothetical protein
MGNIGFNVNSEEKKEYGSLSIPCDYQHALCIGATGSGKTASVILPAMKDRIEKNHALLAYIYKGHEDKKIKQMAKDAGRLSDVIEIGKPHGSYINLLSMLDREGVKNVFLALLGAGTHSSNRDPYWSNAASRVGVIMVEITRQMYKIHKFFIQNSTSKITFNQVKVTLEINDKKEDIIYLYPTEVPTFQTLFRVTNHAKYMKCFFDGLEIYIEQVHNALKNEIQQANVSILLSSNSSIEADQIKKFTKQVSKDILKLEKIIDNYGKFFVSIDSGESGGNNGVLQILNNALMGVSNRDYINDHSLDLLEAIENKAIIIIDIEGLGKDVHGALLESILSKLAIRVRNGTPSSVSIFIDEANRVLSEGTDIHNDVLREANVELIVAIQNEEQMITKFGDVAWQAIRKNFKHNYEINLDHNISYNNESNVSVLPLLFQEKSLRSAEYDYNFQEHVQKILYENFDIETALPMKFNIVYTVNIFESLGTIDIVDHNNMILSIEYLGVRLKQNLKLQMKKYGFAQKHIQKSLSI